jgi:hypothetical protein
MNSPREEVDQEPHPHRRERQRWRLHTNVEEGLDHYAVTLTDPEGNKFDIN